MTVAADTAAPVAPKKTLFSDGVALKPVPVMVTTVPMGPDEGEKEVMLCAFILSAHKRITINNTQFILT